MITTPSRTLPQHLLHVHLLLTFEDREQLQLAAAEAINSWTPGRLGTGYFKTPTKAPSALFARARSAVEAFVFAHELGEIPANGDFDEWLVYFPPMSFAAPHRDVIEDGDATHVRLVVPIGSIGLLDSVWLHDVEPTVPMKNAGPVKVKCTGDGFVFAPSEVTHEVQATTTSRLFYSVGARVARGAK